MNTPQVRTLYGMCKKHNNCPLYVRLLGKGKVSLTNICGSGSDKRKNEITDPLILEAIESLEKNETGEQWTNRVRAYCGLEAVQ